jgi:orotate phosphoribosyltransferase
VVLVEDVVTTGTQVLKAAAVLEGVGAEIQKVVAVLDRRGDGGPCLGGYPFEALLRIEDMGVGGGD